MSRDLFARDQGKLGKGTEFTGYATRFLPHSNKLETLTLISDLSAIDKDDNISIDLYLFDTITLCISLFILYLNVNSLQANIL